MALDFHYTDGDFHFFKDFAKKHAGIDLADNKKEMVYGRVVRALRSRKLNSFSEYCELLKLGDDDAISEFLNAITTNLTFLFREQHHFDDLKEKVIPYFMKKNIQHKIRGWSAGCSTGEEAYSIAIVLKEFKDLSSWDVKLLATDLDSNVIEKAKKGEYLKSDLEKFLSNPSVMRWLIPVENKKNPAFRFNDEIKSLISFNRLNLFHQWPMQGEFEFIFCRNVMIYFDLEDQKKLIDNFVQKLKPGGYLFIGHSEISNHNKLLEFVGKSTYRKVEGK